MALVCGAGDGDVRAGSNIIVTLFCIGGGAELLLWWGLAFIVDRGWKAGSGNSMAEFKFYNYSHGRDI